MRWILCLAVIVSSFAIIDPPPAEAGGALIRALADKRQAKEPRWEKIRHARAMKGPRNGGRGGNGSC